MSKDEQSTTINSLLRRAEIFLEDKDWKHAEEYYEKALDCDPENSNAYTGLLLVSLKISSEKELINSNESFNDNNFYQKAVRFATPKYRETLQQYNIDNIYFLVQNLMKHAKRASDYTQAKMLLQKVAEQTDVKALIEDCEKKEKELKKKNTKSIYILVSIVLLFNIIVLLAITINNNKKSKEIYNNFVGKTFCGEIENDDGFLDAYYDNSLNQYQIYWNTLEESTLKFNEDGTVYYTYLIDKSVLAYPKGIGVSKPEDYHHEYDGTYDSFSVSVSLFGNVYLHLGKSKYKIFETPSNEPREIYDYDNMDLGECYE